LKKILLALFIFFLGTSVKAQEMNFEETVKYIKGKLVNTNEPVRYKLSNWSSWVFIKNIEISKEGKFKFFYNDEKIIIDLFELEEQPNGLHAYKEELYFVKRGGSLSYFWVYSISDAERLQKAFLHLKSLCTKEKEPFD
jgi:hypothetical protein